MQFQSIKKLAVLALIITAFLSCNNEPTLQTYYVDNELKPGFTTFDVPMSLINVEKVKLSEQQERAYNSVSKLNVLAFKLDESNIENYKKELKNLESVLANDKYEDLMSGGNAVDGNFTLKMVGEIDSIDELIIFANSKKTGFVVARVLGSNMNVNDIMSLQTLMNKIDFDNTDLGGLTDFFN